MGSAVPAVGSSLRSEGPGTDRLDPQCQTGPTGRLSPSRPPQDGVTPKRGGVLLTIALFAAAAGMCPWFARGCAAAGRVRQSLRLGQPWRQLHSCLKRSKECFLLGSRSTW